LEAAGTQRDSAWERLGAGPFDLVIVGGGVIGAGAARDAARRGLRVAVIEADDIASGTSSRSSKLIHGGLRYLEQGDLALVFESVNERGVMMKIAPHLVRPMGFLFPIYTGDKVKLGTLRLGLIVYEGLALFRSPKLHTTLKPKDLAEDMPLLRQAGLRGGPLYWDCATDDARITLETMLDAVACGATVLTHARVTRVLRDDSGHVCGVQVRDNLREREVSVRAGAVLNATGPWSDKVRGTPERPSNQLRLTKGVHIVVPAARLPIAHTIVCFHPTDKRLLFILPWGEQVYIGTTDTDYEGDPRDVAADRADIDYLLAAVDKYFPTVQLRPEEVTCTWAGLRPLIRAEGVPPSQVSREHVITVDPDGLVSIAGGKLTTHRRMGAEVVETCLEGLRRRGHPLPALEAVNTAAIPLPGAVGWPVNDDGTLMAKRVADAAPSLSAATCRYLADRYGGLALEIAALAAADQRLQEPLCPGRPEILAQVDWAVTRELAATVTDVLERRTQLYFRDVDQGLGAVERVAHRMADLLGWTAAERDASAEAYRREVAQSRRWRSEMEEDKPAAS
jgi:glycerol-3-phosphate dehydrogenase